MSLDDPHLFGYLARHNLLPRDRSLEYSAPKLPEVEVPNRTDFDFDLNRPPDTSLMHPAVGMQVTLNWFAQKQQRMRENPEEGLIENPPAAPRFRLLYGFSNPSDDA